MNVRTRDMWLLFVVSLALRLVYAAFHTQSLYFNTPILDSLWIHQWAMALADGSDQSSEAFFRAPLYPYWVSGIYRLFGPHPWVVGLIQHVMGAGSVVLLYRIASARFGRSVGWVAGWLLSLYWLVVFFEGELLIVTLAMFLSLVFVDRLLAARGAIGFALAGGALGLACIARPNFLVWVPILILVPWLRDRTLRSSTRIGWAVAAGLGAVLVISPVTIRNAVVGGDLVPIASQGGLNFYVGNGPGADGKTARAPGAVGPMQREVAASRYRDNVTLAGTSIAEVESGHDLAPSEVSVFWFRKTFRYVQNEPIRAAILMVKKTSYFLNGFEISDNVDLGELTVRNIWIYFFPVRLVWVLPLSVLGVVWVVYRSYSLGYLYVSLTLLYALSVVLFFVNARLRLPVAPWFMLFAAIPICMVWDRWSTRSDLADALRPSSSGAWLRLAGLLILGIALTVPRVFAVDERAARSGFLMNRGTLLLEAGRCEEARSAFEAAISADPNMMEARYQIARLHERCGDPGAALQAYRDVVRLYPEFTFGHIGLARALAASGDSLTADRAFRAGLAADPESAELLFSYAGFLVSGRQFPAAAEAYRRGLIVDPSQLRSWMNYGYTLMQLGHVDEAVSAWERALRLDPGNRMALNNIAAARQGENQ